MPASTTIAHVTISWRPQLRIIALAVTRLLLWSPLQAQQLHAYRMPSVAMEPTIRIGEILVFQSLTSTAEELIPDVKRGDLVIFRDITADDSGLVVAKRVIGLPGDTLQMQRGRLHRNGADVAEPYATRSDTARVDDSTYVSEMYGWQVRTMVGGQPSSYRPTRNDWGPIVVPDAAVFVLGDNRDHSYDSRYFGSVPRTRLMGLVVEIRDSAQRVVRWTRQSSPQ